MGQEEYEKKEGCSLTPHSLLLTESSVIKLSWSKHKPTCTKRKTYLRGWNQEPRRLILKARGWHERRRRGFSRSGNLMEFAWILKWLWTGDSFFLAFLPILNWNVSISYLRLVSPLDIRSIVTWELVSLAPEAYRWWGNVTGYLTCTWFILPRRWALGFVSWWDFDDTWEFWVDWFKMKFWTLNEWYNVTFCFLGKEWMYFAFLREIWMVGP